VKERVIFFLKIIFLGFVVFIWIKSIALDIKVKEILTSEEITQVELLNVVNGWPNAKASELIAVRIASADPNCEVLDKIGTRIIDIDSRYAQGWYIDALCKGQKLDYQGALNSINNAIIHDPLNPDYLIFKLKVCIALNQKKFAQTTLAIIMRNYPENPEIASLESTISTLS
jgi:hypothetical protein